MSEKDPSGDAIRPIDVGDTLGQYKLVELLAIGGMGLIYRAYDKSLDRYVAVKVLSPKFARDREIARRFLNEARAAATFNHPNVVHVYSAGEQNGIFYFVMELVHGQHIEALLSQQGRLPVREAVDYTRQAALGLQHAHELGIIHGDVKPANFLVTETGTVKVADFGLARHVKSAPGRTAGESFFGTPGYISPEVCRGQPPDHRSDIYSLGATLFHMLAGRPPFVADTPDETLRQQIEAPIPSLTAINPKVSPALNQIVARMLAKDPATRYQTYTALLLALERQTGEKQQRSLGGPRTLVNDAPKKTPGEPPGELSPPPKPPKRETPASIAFTWIAVVACILLTYLFYRTRSTVEKIPPPPSAVKIERQALLEFNALHAKADELLTRGQAGLAYATYASWPATNYAGTSAEKAVITERAHLLEVVQQQWSAGKTKIAALQADNKFTEAMGVCDQLARTSEGLADLTGQIPGIRRSIEAARLAAKALEPATSEPPVAPQSAYLKKFKAQLASDITSLQWDKGRQEIQQARTEAGNEAEIRDELPALQTELDSLLALRQAVANRLKVAPSPEITLATKRGEMKGQITGFDNAWITLRQSFGDSGFAESSIGWNELTPASVCRFFAANLDAEKPEELFGYAVLITHYALVKQARIEDARKTSQILVQRDPSKTQWVERSLTQLDEVEQSTRSAPVTTVPPAENEAATQWGKILSAVTNNQWPRVTDTLAAFVKNYGSTEFGKSHAGEIQQLTRQAAQHAVVQPYVSLDIGPACNANFILKHDGEQADKGLLVDNTFGSEEYFHHQIEGGTGLPNKGRIQITNNAADGLYQLRMIGRKDAIALSADGGRFLNAVTVELPVEQQRRYTKLGLLSTSSNGQADIRVTLKYQTGEAESQNLKIYDWVATPPAAANVSVSASQTHPPRHEARMFADVLNLDPQRRLLSFTFTWLSSTSKNPQQCVGIFAVSAMPVDAGPR